MKTFFAIFFACFFFICIFLMFGGILLFENFWALVGLASFVLAIFISILFHQETKLEELEKRLEALETPHDKADGPQA